MRPKIKRAFPIDGVLKKYFILRQGSPSQTISYDDKGTAAPKIPPAWLIGNCQVGVLIQELDAMEWVALMTRWFAAIESEDAGRAANIAERRIGKLERRLLDCRHEIEEFKRRGVGELQAMRQKELSRIKNELVDLRVKLKEFLEAEIEMRREKERVERLMAYQRAMIYLGERFQEVGLLKIFPAAS